MCAGLFLFSAAAAFAQEGDVRGSSDHPLFPNRMPGFRISLYREAGFQSESFPTTPPTVVEGKYTKINYYLVDAKNHPGGIAIRRNYENAIKAIGGQVVRSAPGISVVKATHNGRETWASVLASDTSSGRYYYLTIVEKEAMAQVVTADSIGAAIDKAGFIALNIEFEFGKATIEPVSTPIIDQIVELLRKRPALRISVEGHTDNIGNVASNKTLSLARAQAVVSAMTAKGVAAARMTSAGFGAERPVADEGTEAGRQKNRRVEIRKL